MKHSVDRGVNESAVGLRDYVDCLVTRGNAGV